MHTLIHTPKGNLERTINLTGISLDCGRKPEYLVSTHTYTGRTCKLHAERPPARSQTQDLLAARQQCYKLCHCAAPKPKRFTIISLSFAEANNTFCDISKKT
ncbi:hypothetical protein ATANTOWER_020965 [Ataeniobius toweri]|uniref:Uncharacterized protein n=1 Tax=Ataeniobius toweri TaxID=208326 RepID=A0ABU7AGB1_9TELE|nr:hypothetical protein [Ataeniobius toweri]